MAKEEKLVQSAANVGRYRWTILALVFYATSVNYFDRSIIGVLAPTLTRVVSLDKY